MAKNIKTKKAVSALLTSDISYQKDGQEILVPRYTAILIDIDRGVALIGEDHIDIFPDEYEVLTA